MNVSRMAALNQIQEGNSFTDLPKLSVEKNLVPQAESHLRLAYNLHASLDFHKIIEQFATGLQEEVAISGIQYDCEPEHVRIIVGEAGIHEFSCGLHFGKEYLGKIIFMRETAFQQEEIAALENLLCLVVHPLRNGLQYFRALQCALKDPLTGLPNRAALQPALHRDMELAKRYETPLSLLALDLDHFKLINDRYGHVAGDEVLKAFAKQLSESVRESDMVFRIGGEEFIILLSKTDLEGAELLATRICQSIEAMDCSYKQQSLRVTVSIGVSTFVTDDTEVSLIERADHALYEAKKQGRNRVCRG